MDLITNNQLTERFGIPWSQVENALKTAQLDPVHQYSNGRGNVRLYATDDAVRAVEAMLLAKQVAATKRGDPPPPDAEVGIGQRILDALMNADGRAEDRDDKLAQEVAKVAAQNVLLLRAIEHLRADLLPRLEVLQAGVDRLLHPMPPADESAQDAAPMKSAPPVTQRAADPLPPPRPLRVGIISLEDRQRALIEAEFSKCFDLRIVPSHSKRQGGLLDGAVRSCDVVLLMTAFVSPAGIDAEAARVGIRLVRVKGGMTQLRDQLTDLFVNVDEYRRDRATEVA